MGAPDLQRIIRRLDDLPTLPRTLLRITELMNDPKTSARDLALIIAEDQVLTARLLRIVNSSFYGFPQRVATVTTAIVLVGFEAIRNLLLTASVFNLFPAKNRQARRLLEQLWDHALGCAAGAKAIGRHLRRERVEELFVAGLLHDIGKIVAMALFPADFTEALRRAEREGTSIVAAEQALLGFDHTHAGRLLAERWRLPPRLVAAIAGHHHPAAPGADETAAIVHVADIFARALGLGSGGTERVPPVDPAAWQRLKLRTGALDAILAATLDEFDHLHPFLS
jgi:putative nucleotidyltransferase with HDIG domain